MKFLFVTLVAVNLLLIFQPVSAQLTPQQQKGLTAFARLYGYVRYFHPSDEAAGLDWDNFAIYGAKRVTEASNDHELIGTLKEMFHPFAPMVDIYPSAEKDSFSIAGITPPDKENYLPIAWQHLGVGLDMQNPGIYKSIRVNRPLPEKPASQGFAPIAQTFPASQIKGKDFRLSGWIKVDSTSGGAGYLMVRIQKKGKVVFFYNMSDRPATSGAWQEYTISGTANKEADTITIGAMLGGKGAMWIDHLQLAVKDGSEWKNISLDNGGFEARDPKPWKYNPSLADYRFVTVTTDAQEGGKAMYITSIADPSKKNQRTAKPLYAQYPKPGEIIQRRLATGIDCIVPLALYGTKERTYPQGDSMELVKLENAIRASAPAGSNGDNPWVRMGDVVILWNVWRHFFPYWEDATCTPDELLDKALTKTAGDRDRYDFLGTLQQMTGFMNDGHMYATLQGDTTHRAYAPVILIVGEGKLVVDMVLDSTIDISRGDVVETINGEPAAQYMANIDGKESGSPQLKVFRDVVSLTIGPRGSVVTFGLRRDDSVHNVRLTRSIEWQPWYAALGKRPSSGWIRSGIFYIDLDKDPMDSIRAWMPQLEKARAIVCDLRGYPNSNHEFISHLLTETENTKWMFIPEVIYPDYERVTYSGGGWNMHPINPRLSGKVLFITDGSAISYAESYMGFIKDLHLATIIGQPTAGTNGNINRVALPGGYHLNFTGMLVKDHQGGKHHLKGIAPDVPVERTIKGIREGRDEMLEKALQIASGR
jgi:C-terminal processing protease CtpA/Prc